MTNTNKNGDPMILTLPLQSDYRLQIPKKIAKKMDLKQGELLEITIKKRLP